MILIQEVTGEKQIFESCIRKGMAVKMNIIVHYPQSTEGKDALEEKVATVYAQSVLQKLQSLSCPKEQKSELLEYIKKEVGI